MLRDMLVGRMLGEKDKGKKMDTAVDDLIRNSIYTGLKKAAEDKSVLWTLRRDS